MCMHIYKNQKDKKLIFLVFNTACFGDVLLCNSLCQNIKLFYPDSKVVFIVDKPFYDAAKYQKDVDDVVIFDKKGVHKGFWGLIKFIFEFKYKHPFAAFITYKNFRNSIISTLLFSKHVIMVGNNFPIISMGKRHASLITKLTHKPFEDLPIRYEAPADIPQHLEELLFKGEKYIAINPITKRKDKNIPLSVLADLIKKINTTDFKVVLCGRGKLALKYSKELRAKGCDFIDIVDKTTILELAQVLNNCKALISADTGTMHLGCALNIFTMVVFYETEKIEIWAPDKNLYNSVIISENQTAENIYKCLNLPSQQRRFRECRPL